MSSLLVLGDRGSGLTTFVGLLYTVQVRLGTDESDEFRFHADRETIRQLESIYGELGAGRFPYRDLDWEEHPMSFVLGFRHGTFLGRVRGADHTAGAFDTVRVEVGGISVDELAELGAHDAILGEATRRLLRSQAILLLVDASQLAPDPDGAVADRIGRYDRVLEASLDLLGKFLAAQRHRRARTMHPYFVVTKFDQCPPETLDRLAAPAGDPTTWSSEDRLHFGERLLHSYLFRTELWLESSRRSSGGNVADPCWFFSSLRTEEARGELRIARRSIVPRGGWEPDYPFEEYRAMIHSLGALAHRLPELAEA
ncbi:MAG: hypothetical protein WA691_08640 [Thermoplasmata archaeon]